MEGGTAGDESLLRALAGMLNEYMSLDTVVSADAPDDGAGADGSVAADARAEDDGDDDGGTVGVPGRYHGTATAIDSSGLSPPIDDLPPPPIPTAPQSSVLDLSADTFTSLIADIVNADAVQACAGQQRTALESARRIIKDLNRSNTQLGHDFPSVQRDVMKCLNLVDSIRKDMQRTELSIARTKQMLHIDALALPQIPASPGASWSTVKTDVSSRSVRNDGPASSKS